MSSIEDSVITEAMQCQFEQELIMFSDAMLNIINEKENKNDEI